MGGLIAAAMRMSDADFLAGKYQFGQPTLPGKVENLGTFISREGGFVTLIGGSVNNAGQIVTPAAPRRWWRATRSPSILVLPGW